MSATFEFGSSQHRGAREHQEDVLDVRVSTTVEEALLLLADGMGGHAGGQEAAMAAVQSALNYETQAESIAALDLQTLIETANQGVKTLHRNQPEFAEGGCTFVAARLVDGDLTWISTGDSPLYLISSGKVSRLNADHSMTPLLRELVDSGRLLESELASHPQRNALRSSLVGDEIELIDESETPLKLQPGEIVILASDGIDTLSHGDIADLVLRHDGNMQSLADELIEQVLERDKCHQDNVSLICLRLLEAEVEPQTRRLETQTSSVNVGRRIDRQSNVSRNSSGAKKWLGATLIFGLLGALIVAASLLLLVVGD